MRASWGVVGGGEEVVVACRLGDRWEMGDGGACVGGEEGGVAVGVAAGIEGVEWGGGEGKGEGGWRGRGRGVGEDVWIGRTIGYAEVEGSRVWVRSREGGKEDGRIGVGASGWEESEEEIAMLRMDDMEF